MDSSCKCGCHESDLPGNCGCCAKCPYCNGKGCEHCEDGSIDLKDMDCDNCGFDEKIPLKAYTGCPTNKRVFLLCEICASTFLSKAAIYPRQCKDVSLYQSIGWIANKILEEIRGQKAKGS